MARTALALYSFGTRGKQSLPQAKGNTGPGPDFFHPGCEAQQTARVAMRVIDANRAKYTYDTETGDVRYKKSLLGSQ
eukprot:8242167-Lingulodinium_polyedra.AAC.1